MDDMTTRMQIAQRFRQAREQAGLSQGQAARLMKVHRPTISEIEAGRRRVVAEELAVFAQCYGVSISWLMGGGTSAVEEESIELVARRLERLKPEDRQKVMEFINTLGQGEE